MPERLVVCLRFSSTAANERDELGTLLGALSKRAVAHGAHLVGWHAGAVAFIFAPDALEDAVALLADEPLPEGSAAGLAQGELTRVVEGGGKIRAVGRARAGARDGTQRSRPERRGGGRSRARCGQERRALDVHAPNRKKNGDLGTLPRACSSVSQPASSGCHTASGARARTEQ